jgi:predicted DNA-binding protein (MmcQ/YjbR family)
MTIDQLLEHSLAKPDIEESFPFGEDVLVLKVRGKVFLLINLNNYPLQFNVKCDPERAVELREAFNSIIPGYHMNKKHWNTIILDGTVPSSLIFELIDHSYTLVSTKSKKTTIRQAKL